MKISKLFHWLYAILMLLPVFFIAGRCLYTIFNKNAKDSYSGDTWVDLQPTYYQSNEVTSINSFIVGNVYSYTDNLGDLGTSSNNYEPYFNIRIMNGQYASTQNYTLYRDNNILYVTNSQTFWLRVNGVPFDFLVVSLGQSLNNMPQAVLNAMSFCEVQYFKEYVEVQQQESLDNAFIYSVNQLNDVPLFSWAKDSFLVTPFTYITGLFGVPNDSPINTMLSYWLDISIIWLVFDLVMYVPLLVHRWLDKGVLE